MKGPEAGGSPALSGHHEHAGVPRRAAELYTPQEQIEGAVVNAVELPDDAVIQYILRRAAAEDGIVLHQHHHIGQLGGQVHLVEGEHHGQSPVGGHFPEDVQQFNLMADVQIAGGLIQDNNLRLLA